MPVQKSGITIRAADERDAELLTKIHQECFVNYWNLSAFNDFFSVAGTLALVAEEVASALCLVCGKQDFLQGTRHASQGTPLGMIVYRATHEQADIITIAVLPAHRRQGIAEALFLQALQYMQALGVKSLFLDVEEGNEAALKLYQKHGFNVQNRRKQYYKQKDGSFTDALVMMRKLR